MDRWVTSGELYALAIRTNLIGFVLGDKGEHSQRIKLGKALTAQRGRRFSDRIISAGTDPHTKVAQYRLTKAEPNEQENDNPESFLRYVGQFSEQHTANIPQPNPLKED